MLNCQQAIVVVILVLLVNLFQFVSTYPIYQFHQQSYMIPHPQKAHRGGQDAFFSNSELLIIADGVGGWNEYGIDPSKYSRFLCSKGGQIFQDNKQFYRDNVVEIIVQTAKLNQNLGSSTMVVLSLAGQQLRTCYIGDSGFVIFRYLDGEYKTFYQFKQQQHAFNFPFQLARKDYKGDDPYLSICHDFQIQDNDILVVGSDGLFDNIYVEQIRELINKTFKDDQKLFALKERLAKLAIQRGQDNGFWSPFAQRAKQLSIRYRGGKLDDTTVIISKFRKINQTDTDKLKIKIDTQSQPKSSMQRTL